MDSLSLDSLLSGLIEFLSIPIIAVQAILTNIWSRADFILGLAAAGRSISVARVFDLIKWGFLALFIFALAAFICVDTFRRIFIADIGRKRAVSVLFDLVLTFLALLFYYLVLALALNLFFNLVLPIQRVL